MSNPETRFSKRIRKLLPSGGHQVRVENPAHPGTPDYNDCIEGVEIWLEFKQTPSFPARPDTPVFGKKGLRPDQVVWHVKRARAGGRSYIVALVEESDVFYVIEGKHAREFNDMTRAELDSLTLPLEVVWAKSPTGG